MNVPSFWRTTQIARSYTWRLGVSNRSTRRPRVSYLEVICLLLLPTYSGIQQHLIKLIGQSNAAYILPTTSYLVNFFTSKMIYLRPRMITSKVPNNHRKIHDSVGASKVPTVMKAAVLTCESTLALESWYWNIRVSARNM
jgi:hypothetical protein